MIHYSNIQRYNNMPFDEYLKLPGYSHSFLKQERYGIASDFNITDNIRVGKMVDEILTDPLSGNMNDPLYGVAKDIAHKIQSTFGSMIAKFERQISYTATMEYEGFCMPTKGRIDYLLPGFAVIDLKVTFEKNIHALINYMGYPNQKWHYTRLADVARSYILIHSVPLKKTELIKISCSEPVNEFWKEKVLKFGKVKQTQTT